MSVLSYQTLLRRLPEIIATPHRDEALVNPASIDIRIGGSMRNEFGDAIDLSRGGPWALGPGAFALIGTFEWITVPNDLVIELKLKSSIARQGYNHSLAFWVDPGWAGILTMEVSNITQHQHLPLTTGMRFAQLIVHTLDELCAKPYAGRYQGAVRVEGAKS